MLEILGEEVAFTYKPQMLVDSVIGTDTYVSGTSYDAAGRVIKRDLSAGAMQTAYIYYPWDNAPYFGESRGMLAIGY
jgi:hypothetical protein